MCTKIDFYCRQSSTLDSGYEDTSNVGCAFPYFRNKKMTQGSQASQSKTSTQNDQKYQALSSQQKIRLGQVQGKYQADSASNYGTNNQNSYLINARFDREPGSGSGSKDFQRSNQSNASYRIPAYSHKSLNKTGSHSQISQTNSNHLKTNQPSSSSSMQHQPSNVSHDKLSNSAQKRGLSQHKEEPIEDGTSHEKTLDKNNSTWQQVQVDPKHSRPDVMQKLYSNVSSIGPLHSLANGRDQQLDLKTQRENIANTLANANPNDAIFKENLVPSKLGKLISLDMEDDEEISNKEKSLMGITQVSLPYRPEQESQHNSTQTQNESQNLQSKKKHASQDKKYSSANDQGGETKETNDERLIVTNGNYQGSHSEAQNTQDDTYRSYNNQRTFDSTPDYQVKTTMRLLNEQSQRTGVQDKTTQQLLQSDLRSKMGSQLSQRTPRTQTYQKFRTRQLYADFTGGSHVRTNDLINNKEDNVQTHDFIDTLQYSEGSEPKDRLMSATLKDSQYFQALQEGQKQSLVTPLRDQMQAPMLATGLSGADKLDSRRDDIATQKLYLKSQNMYNQTPNKSVNSNGSQRNSQIQRLVQLRDTSMSGNNSESSPNKLRGSKDADQIMKLFQDGKSNEDLQHKNKDTNKLRTPYVDAQNIILMDSKSKIQQNQIRQDQEISFAGKSKYYNPGSSNSEHEDMDSDNNDFSFGSSITSKRLSELRDMKKEVKKKHQMINQEQKQIYEKMRSSCSQAELEEFELNTFKSVSQLRDDGRRTNQYYKDKSDFESIQESQELSECSFDEADVQHKPDNEDIIYISGKSRRSANNRNLDQLLDTPRSCKSSKSSDSQKEFNSFHTSEDIQKTEFQILVGHLDKMINNIGDENDSCHGEQDKNAVVNEVTQLKELQKQYSTLMRSWHNQDELLNSGISVYQNDLYADASGRQI